MNNKRKQIEEMANELCWLREDEYREIANLLYEVGYRKIPENAVVLTEDNAEELGNMIVESPQMQKAMKNLIKEWRKETEEKFAEKLKEKADYMDSYSCGKKGVFIKDIDEICKEFTEGEYGESLCEE